ncbi:MAG: N-6 DNA methylase [Nanoarchaeota archaeon]|nr:N-6 DNA methylase [Nanoarchaeota archaeon]
MVSKEEAKRETQKLIERYESFKSSGELKNFIGKEENTKTTFILPLFKALGWDVHNEKGIEVLTEERVLKGAVDYAFQLQGAYKFFVEAKPIGSSLKEHAKQAMEYGVNSGNTWVVLTNFESIIVFNCEWREKEWWKNTLFEQIDYKDYLAKFDSIWLLSKESINANGLEEYAEKIAKRVPRTPIDKELLSNLLQYRIKISKDINQFGKYSAEEIDELIQKLLSRLLFIRNCEDRGFEVKYKLQPLIELYKLHKKGLMKALAGIFKHYDEVYNSGIFKESEIDKIKFDEQLLADVLERLYFTSDGLRYNFYVIPADVMGNLYEQYLGHILKKTPERTKLKDGKAHRKEQGIYYTPAYIVDYIVKNTVGELLKDKKVKPDKIRILDPACGSGSFLIKAFQAMDEYYKGKDKRYSQTKLDSTGAYSKKVEILQNNIFGVDLDKQAIELARLNLLLHIAEKGEKLPSIEKKIQCGNSLIDNPAVAGEDKAFKWEDRFKDVMDEGGFDVVIGNPPYVDIKQLEPSIVKYFFSKYSTVENRMNLYAVFVEKSVHLLKEGGYFGFIIPNSILYNKSYQKLRALLLDKVTLRKIIRLPDNVFQNVKVETIILIYQKKREITKNLNCEVFIYSREVTINTINKENNAQIISFNQGVWKTEPNTINISTNASLITILNKIEEETKPLIDICDFSLGLTPYDKYKGHSKNQIEERVFHSQTKKNATFKPLLSGGNIVRYGIFWDNKEYISYGNWLGAPREERFFTKPRIVVRQIVSGNPLRIYAGYTEEEIYNTQIAFNIVTKEEGKISLKYLLLLLNSKLMTFYHKEKYLDPSKNLFQKILIVNTKKLPIKIIPIGEQQPFIQLVDKMLSLNKLLNELGDKKTDERTRIEEEIKKTDAEIDELVYKIYGITDKEKKIIEDNLKK